MPATRVSSGDGASFRVVTPCFRLYFECAVRIRESKRITIVHTSECNNKRDRTPRLGCDRCVAPSFIDLATRSPMSLHYISFITLPMPQRGNAIVLASSKISGCSTIVRLDAFDCTSSRLFIICLLAYKFAYKLDWFFLFFFFIATLTHVVYSRFLLEFFFFYANSCAQIGKTIGGKR